MIKVGDTLPAVTLTEYVEVEGNGCSIGPNPVEVAKAAAGNLSLPVHLVRGGASDLISLEAAERFINFVSGAHFTDVSGAGHMVVGDDNDVFSRAIIDFLEVQDKLREAV